LRLKLVEIINKEETSLSRQYDGIIYSSKHEVTLYTPTSIPMQMHTFLCW